MFHLFFLLFVVKASYTFVIVTFNIIFTLIAVCVLSNL